MSDEQQPPTLTPYSGPQVATHKEAGPLLKVIGRMLKPKAPKVTRPPRRMSKVAKVKKQKFY